MERDAVATQLGEEVLECSYFLFSVEVTGLLEVTGRDGYLRNLPL